jgi:quercetin dioxygenase-like cupin family protein
MQRFLIRTSIVGIFLGLFLVAIFIGWQSLGETSVKDLQQPTPTPSQSFQNGYVLRADEGEVLQRGKGNTVIIKVDPKTGSPNMAMGTQLLDSGARIPVHRHDDEDEILFIHNGNGIAVLGNQKKAVGKGDTIYVPRGVWHGVETQKEGIDLLWIVTPPGLEGFFREISSPIGSPPKALTPAQIQDIGHKHGVKFKPQ